MQQELKRGDIYIVNLGNGVGSIQGGFARPVIIVANSMCCKHSPILHCVPLTSKNKKWMPTHCEIPVSTGLTKESTALCEQVQLLPRELFTEKIGACGDVVMSKINKALMVQFGLFSNDPINNIAYA